MKQLTLAGRASLGLFVVISALTVLTCQTNSSKSPKDVKSFNSAGWYKLDGNMKCLSKVGCEQGGKHYNTGDVIELPRCGTSEALDNLNGFDCVDNLWRCTAQSCDCMGTTITSGTACTVDGPYDCSAVIPGARCEQGKLYCGNELAPQNTEGYLCTQNNRWICDAEKCKCGDTTILQRDLCIDGQRINYCVGEDDNYSDLFDACYGSLNAICLRRHYDSLGFKEFDVVYGTDGCSGCGTQKGVVCGNPASCQANGLHYNYLGGGTYDDQLGIAHYDRFEDNTSGIFDGECVIDHVENDPAHLSLHDKTSAYTPSIYDCGHTSFIKEEDPLPCHTLNDSLPPQEERNGFVYDNKTCPGGAFLCGGKDNKPTKKPKTINDDYYCLNFIPQTDDVLPTHGDVRAWVCYNNKGCDCGDTKCSVDSACVNGTCVKSKGRSSCDYDAILSDDGKCLCDGKEAPNDRYNCEQIDGTFAWRCSFDCACGQNTCSYGEQCVDGKCLCGGVESPMPGSANYKCENNHWQCYSNDPNSPCKCGNSVCNEGEICSNDKCVCGKETHAKPNDPTGYECTYNYEFSLDKDWFCNKAEGCLCGGSYCPINSKCINETCYCTSPNEDYKPIPYPSKKPGYYCDNVQVEIGASGEWLHDTIVNDWRCEEEKGCLCGDKLCPQNTLCHSGQCLCDDRELARGYTCNTEERYDDYLHEERGSQECVDEKCICGGKSCPKGAMCIKDECVCNGHSFIGENIDEYVCAKDSDDGHYWTCDKPDGCKCGNETCFGRESCVEGQCKCGSDTSPGPDWSCSGSSWYCNNDNGCLNMGKRISQHGYYYACDRDFETKADGCYCGGVKYGAESKTIEQYYCTEGGKTMVCDTLLCQCGDSGCIQGAACVDGACVDVYTKAPMPRENGYIVNGALRVCANADGCDCGTETCTSGESCILQHCAKDPYGYHRYMSLYDLMYEGEAHEKWDTSISEYLYKEIPTATDEAMLKDYADFKIDDSRINSSGLVCINRDGCACGTAKCREGALCDLAQNVCIYTEAYAATLCGNPDDGVSTNAAGDCVCRGTVRAPNEAGYVCSELGWLCSSDSGCACGDAKCNPNAICVKPGVCAE